MKNYGLIEVATVSPKEIFIGNPIKNTKIIFNYIKEIIDNNYKNKNTQLIVFPELCITGYTCGDLFLQSNLIESSLDCLHQLEQDIVSLSKLRVDKTPLIVVGLPIKKDNQLFNCAAILDKTGLIAIIPKTIIPNYNSFCESKYFSSGLDILNDKFDFFGKDIPFSTNILIKDRLSDMVLGVDISEDLFSPISPSRYHCIYGANIIVNLAASDETIGKTKYREDMIKMFTSTTNCSYLYTSASKDESTTDCVFSGHQIIACNGNIINSTNSFFNDKDILIEQIDVEKCMNNRSKNTSYMQNIAKKDYITVYTSTFTVFDYIKMTPSLTPFITTNMNERMKEILNIQATGLAQRLKKINCNKVVLGISGGLDSTLALIVCVEAFKLLNIDNSNIIGVTMPCFGTTNRTLQNSLDLMKYLNTTIKNISIKEACTVHLNDIGHSLNNYDITFENAQARERTQVLMDIANQENAIVVGTGDLSELALGWCTYNGDQMSMYGVNAGIPKTLVRSLVKTYAELIAEKNVDKVLLDICDTPVSPELLPPNPDGTIAQKTEDNIGSYIIHDFVLYYMLRYGFSPSKIFYLCLNAMIKNYEKENNLICKQNQIEEFKNQILKNMKIFYKRFFTQQFKRSCMPDGVKVGSISLSPRGDWKMPSDATSKLWLDELNNIK